MPSFCRKVTLTKHRARAHPQKPSTVPCEIYPSQPAALQPQSHLQMDVSSFASTHGYESDDYPLYMTSPVNYAEPSYFSPASSTVAMIKTPQQVSETALFPPVAIPEPDSAHGLAYPFVNIRKPANPPLSPKLQHPQPHYQFSHLPLIHGDHSQNPYSPLGLVSLPPFPNHALPSPLSIEDTTVPFLGSEENRLLPSLGPAVESELMLRLQQLQRQPPYLL